jgi:hypothetical protein
VNEFDLVFVVVYAGAVTMLLVDELLESLKSAFIKLYKELFLFIFILAL